MVQECAEPSERFSIVIVSPPGYLFSETFREIGETLQSGLRALGYPAALTINAFDSSSTNIVLGGHLLDAREASTLPERTIIYNFEQVCGASKWIKPAYVDLVRRFRTWDYSERNVKAWRGFCPGVAAEHVPLGYAPELSRIAAAQEEDIDVLFYGVINERRAKILKELQDAGLHVMVVCGKFGAERDALIARAKLVLNMHYFETKILEMPRVSYLLANRKAVVCEIDVDTEADARTRDAVAGVPYERIVEKCLELASDAAARRAVADQGWRIFSQRPEDAILAAALRAPVGARATTPKLPKRINVGSGKDWNFESLNLDVDPMWMPDWLADLNNPLPPEGPVDLGRFGVRAVPQGYFDEIRANHVLEHLPNLVTAMESFLRLLREGGTLSIEVPYDLSLGAWQDPTHVRALNERSWLYYTEWFWYLGWQEYRFELENLVFLVSEFGQELISAGKSQQEVARTPRAVDAMRVTLRKVALSDAEKTRVAQRWLG
jgi:SAM-dependent methyltransferase